MTGARIYMDDTITIKMGRESSTIILNNSDGTVSSKNVDTYDLCQALGSQTRLTAIQVPPFCRMVVQNGNKFSYLFIYPPETRKLILRWGNYSSECLSSEFEECKPNDEEAAAIKRGSSSGDSLEKIKSSYRVFNVPYPALAVITVVNKTSNDNGTGKESYALSCQYALALKNYNLPLNKMDYYRYPFTNVFPDDRCCLGHNFEGTVHSVDGIAYFPTLIFNGSGNTDLTTIDMSHYDTKATNLRFGKVKGEYDLISRLHNAADFPVEYLRKESTEASKLLHKFNSISGNA